MIDASLALETMKVLASGKELVIDGRVYAMVDDGDLVNVAQSSSGEEVLIRTDFSFGGWIRYINGLSDAEKLNIVFQGSINKV